MSKQQNVLFPEDNVLSVGTRTVDPRIGGQNGPMANPAAWGSSMYHTKQKLIRVLVQAPRFMRYMDNGKELAQTLKAIIEMHATSITGLNSSYTMEVEETPQGHGTEVMQTPTLVTQARSEPVLSIPELEGKPVTKLFKRILSDLVMEPGSTHPGIIRSAAYKAAGSPTITPADRSFVTLFIEPNRNLTGVEAAYLCANMIPMEVNDESSHEIQAANEITTLEVPFTALTLSNDRVREMAKKYLDSINKDGFAPSALNPYVTEIEAALLDDALPSEGSSYSKYVNATAEAAGSEA